MIPVDARITIPAFDAFLAERRLTLRATVIGGAALQLMGVIERPTKDCDVLDPELPEPIREAAELFAATGVGGQQLERAWLNNGPSSLIRALPPQWSQRLQPLYSGAALEIVTLGREDFLRSKLFALVDRNIDLPDCVALAPSHAELHTLLPWLDEQDANPDWPRYVRVVLGNLAQELGYGL